MTVAILVRVAVIVSRLTPVRLPDQRYGRSLFCNDCVDRSRELMALVDQHAALLEALALERFLDIVAGVLLLARRSAACRNARRPSGEPAKRLRHHFLLVQFDQVGARQNALVQFRAQLRLDPVDREQRHFGMIGRVLALIDQPFVNLHQRFAEHLLHLLRWRQGFLGCLPDPLRPICNAFVFVEAVIRDVIHGL